MAFHKPQPLKQGNLDGLCGVYAIINAIRLALGEAERLFRRPDWEELFYSLLCSLDDDQRTLGAVASGIGTKPFAKLIRAAVDHMRDEHEIAVTIARLFPPGSKPKSREAIRAIKHATANGTPVIACFSGKLNHWSVVNKVGASNMSLFDSSTHRRIRLANVRMAYEPSKSPPQYILQLGGLWRVAFNRDCEP